jgi:myo-inositol-1(or 4)-monophosphatase
MEAKKLEKIVLDMRDFITTAGEYALVNWSRAVVAEVKDSGADISTNIDRELEQRFSDYVIKNYPGFGFMGEECPELNRSGEYTWVIDPIDGTKYFAKELPMWATTLALLQHGEPILGLVYIPYTKQLFSAWRDGGAYLNGSRLTIPRDIKLEQSQVVWDFSDWNKLESSSEREYYNKVFQELVDQFYRVRVLGSTTYSCTWVAKGMFAAHVDPFRKPEKFVDIAGSVIIAKESGAVVSREPLANGNERIIVGNALAVEQIKKIFSEAS